MTDTSYLEGVDHTTSRADLLDRLRKADNDRRAASEKEQADHTDRIDRLIQKEQEVRQKWSGRTDEEYLSVVVLGTEDEFTTAAEFLDDLSDILPASLQRMHTGLQLMVQAQAQARTP